MDTVLTREQADAIFARLEQLRGEVEAHINSQFYAPFSGQPEANLGALRIAYDTGTASLQATLPATLTGDRSADTWLDLASTVEKSMRDISGYSDGATVRDEFKFVSSQITIEHVSQGFWGIVSGALKGGFAGAPLVMIALILGAIAFVYLFLKKWKVI